MNVSDQVQAARPWIAHYPPGVPAEIEPQNKSTLVDLSAPLPRSLWLRVALESFGARMTYAELGAAADRVTAWLQNKWFRQGRPRGDHGAECHGLALHPARHSTGGRHSGQHQPLYTPRNSRPDPRCDTAYSVRAGKFRRTVGAVREKAAARARRSCCAGRPAGPKGAHHFVSRHIKKAVPKTDLPGAWTFARLRRQAKALKPRPVAMIRRRLGGAAICRTGGTTGTAKGAVLLHRNIAANAEQNIAWFAPTLKSDQPSVSVTRPCRSINLRHDRLPVVPAADGRILPADRQSARYRRTGQDPAKNSTFTFFTGVNTLYDVTGRSSRFETRSISARCHFCVAGGMAAQGPVARKMACN